MLLPSGELVGGEKERKGKALNGLLGEIRSIIAQILTETKQKKKKRENPGIEKVSSESK